MVESKFSDTYFQTIKDNVWFKDITSDFCGLEGFLFIKIGKFNSILSSRSMILGSLAVNKVLSGAHKKLRHRDSANVKS